MSDVVERAKACECLCDTCLDSDCEGGICRPHEVGRWIVESPFMAHPLPSDFDTFHKAENFVAVLGIGNLSVRRVMETEPVA